MMTYRDLWRAVLVFGVLASVAMTVAGPWYVRRTLAIRANMRNAGEQFLADLHPSIGYCAAWAEHERDSCFDNMVEALKAVPRERWRVEAAVQEVELARAAPVVPSITGAQP